MHVLVLTIEWPYYVHGTNTIIKNELWLRQQLLFKLSLPHNHNLWYVTSYTEHIPKPDYLLLSLMLQLLAKSCYCWFHVITCAGIIWVTIPYFISCVTEENGEEPQGNWSMGQDLNPGHPKYEAEVLLTWAWYLITFVPLIEMRVLYFWDYQNVPGFKWKVVELYAVHVSSLHFSGRWCLKFL